MGGVIPQADLFIAAPKPLGTYWNASGTCCRYGSSIKRWQNFFPLPVLESNMAVGVRIRVRKISIFWTYAITWVRIDRSSKFRSQFLHFRGSLCSMVCVPTTHCAPIYRKSAGKPEVLITNKDIHTTVEPVEISTIFQCPGPHYLDPRSQWTCMSPILSDSDY